MKYLLAAILSIFTAVAAELDPVATRALSSGKDSSLNAFFAGQLGIPAASKAIPLKRLTIESARNTNVFNVSSVDKRTIVLFVREKNLTTYYLTDTSGRLRKAIVNDSLIADGGLTNIPIIKAQAGFNASKELWLKTDSAPKK